MIKDKIKKNIVLVKLQDGIIKSVLTNLEEAIVVIEDLDEGYSFRAEEVLSKKEMNKAFLEAMEKTKSEETFKHYIDEIKNAKIYGPGELIPVQFQYLGKGTGSPIYKIKNTSDIDVEEDEELELGHELYDKIYQKAIKKEKYFIPPHFITILSKNEFECSTGEEFDKVGIEWEDH